MTFVKENATPPKPKSSVIVRTVSLFLMLAGIFLIIALGHSYVAVAIILFKLMIFKEIISLKTLTYDKRNFNVNISKKLCWYFFVLEELMTHVLYFEDIQILMSNYFEFQQYKRILFFLAYMMGFVAFVMNLKKGHLQIQIRMFFWTHIVLLLLSFVGAAMVITYNGMIWFILSILLVTFNDTFAYIFGKLFGRTQLIKLSAKKTVEGFIGGALSTVVIGIIIAKLATYDFMTPILCYQNTLTFTPFDYPVCEMPKIFLERKIWLRGISYFTGHVNVSEFMVHSVILAIFASIIAPFGGFFASGFKRSIKIKDFSDLIPGHGGILDRFDCQLVMVIFVYVYMSEIVKGRIFSLNSILHTITHRLSHEDQVLLYKTLRSNLGYD